MAGEIGLGLLALGLDSVFHLSLIRNLTATWSVILWGIVGTIPLMGCLAWVLGRRSGPLRELTDFVVEQFGPVLASRRTTELMLLAGVAGIAEELLFRGVIQTALARVLPASLALLGASVAFGLVHFATATYALLAGMMGLYLGGLFLLQGNLVTPMITHTLYDLAALLTVVHRYRLFPKGPSAGL